MASKHFYSEDNYNDFLAKTSGTGSGESSKGVYTVEYEPDYKENEK